MTKSALIMALSQRFPLLSLRDVEIVVNTILDAMTESLRSGERIEVRGFGSFSVRKRKERQGRNPKTGELIPVQEKRVPFFKPGREIRERVNESRLHFPIDRKKKRPASSDTNAESQSTASTALPG